MPDPKKSAADIELDELLGGPAAPGLPDVPIVDDKLPVTNAPIPKVNQVPDLQASPAADAELDALLAAPQAQMTVGVPEVIKTPVPRPVEQPKPWYEALVPKSMPARPDQAAGRGLDAPLTPASQAAADEQNKSVGQKALDAYTDLSNGTAAALNTATFGLSGRGLEAMGGPSQQQMNAQSPLSTAVGSTAAAVFSPVNEIAAPVQGAGALARMGRAALTNGVINAGYGAQAAHDRGEPELEGAVAGGLTGAALGAGGEGAGALASGLKKKAAEMTSHIFMTPAQRAALNAAKGSTEASGELGQAVRDAGLVKPRGWLDYLRPPTAGRVAENAEKKLATAGAGIGRFEDSIVKSGVNPDVDVAPLVDDLTQMSHESSNRLPLGAEKDAQVAADQADRITKVSQAHGPEGTIPFSEAIKDKRDVAGRIKWNKSAQQDTYGQEAVNKAVWSQLKEQSDAALDKAVAEGSIDPEALATYKKDNREFSTAAQVFDPAMKMAERNAETGLSARELLWATALGGGLEGGIGAMAAKAGRGGIAGAQAGLANKASQASGALSSTLKGGARVLPAMQEAQQKKPDAPKGEQRAEANQITKDQLKRLLNP